MLWACWSKNPQGCRVSASTSNGNWAFFVELCQSKPNQAGPSYGKRADLRDGQRSCYVRTCAVEGMETNSRRIFLAISILFCAIISAFWMSWYEYPWLMRCSISLLIWGLASPPAAPLLGGTGTGGTGLDRRSELIRLGRGFGGLSGASTSSPKAKGTERNECVHTFTARRCGTPFVLL